MSKRTCLAIVLAAGEGTRMRSALPKVLHAIAGRSLLAHVLARRARRRHATRPRSWSGPNRDAVADEAQARRCRRREIFVQTERRGTAHAVLAARAAIEKGADDILVVFGDTPLIRAETLKRLRGALGRRRERRGAGLSRRPIRPATAG